MRRTKLDAQWRLAGRLLLAFLLALVARVGPVPAHAQDLPETGAVSPAPADPRADEALKRALDYLKSSQEPSGAWKAPFGEATSITSLAVMSFLACGHVPGEAGPYAESIERGVRFVLESQKPNGLIVANTSHGPMYCHGISTLMLAEVVGMTPDETLSVACREALAKAVALILQAQAVSKPESEQGGWRYQPSSNDSDISVTAWQLMALRAAKSAGCAVPAENIDRAVDYLKRCVEPGSGGFTYQPGRGDTNNPRTGAGVLSLEICGAHLTAEAIAGAQYLVKHPPKWSSQYFFYEVYYCPQALFQVGDDYFREYYPKLVAILLERQDRDGSWLSGDANDRSGGRVYCTAMAVLALAVEYRYLPIYQR